MRDALGELLRRLETLVEIGYSISMQQEFSLTCTRYVEDSELDDALNGTISAIGTGGSE
jgi:hypothetical protein